MCRLLPFIPIFKGVFLLKLRKECIYMIMLKIALLLVKICFGGKKGYKRVSALGSCKINCSTLLKRNFNTGILL